MESNLCAGELWIEPLAFTHCFSDFRSEFVVHLTSKEPLSDSPSLGRKTRAHLLEEH